MPSNTKIIEHIKQEIERKRAKIEALENGTITLNIKRGKLDYTAIYEAEKTPELVDNLV